MNPHSQKKYVVIALGVIFLLSIFAYSRSFNGELQFDDEPSTVENPYVTGVEKIKCSDFFKNILGFTRPVTAFTFMLNYKMSGTDVRAYHATNFLIHMLNGLLVLYLVFVTANSPRLSGFYRERALLISVISSAIFLLHPVQTQAVSYISQRYESLASFFYLSSLIAYIKARQFSSLFMAYGKEAHGNDELRTANYEQRAKSYLLYVVSIVSGILAFGSKEIAITLPVIIFLYEFYFISERQEIKRMVWLVIFIALSVIAGISIVLGLNKGVSAGFSLREFTASEYLFTQFRVVTTYIRLLFLPVNQNLDYDFRISRSFFEADTLLSFLFLLMLLVSALLLFRRWRFGSFFMLWFFIILAPTSSIVPVIDVIFEHRVYLASAGFFVISADMLSRWILSTDRNKLHAIALVMTALLLASLSAATFQRNKVWETKISLWKDVAKKSPMKSRVRNNLGNCHLLLGDLFPAIEEYKKAISLDRKNIEAYYNLGMSLDNAGFPDQAVKYYQIFYDIAPPKYDEQKKAVRKRLIEHYSETK